MDRQARYDAFLAALPALFVVGGGLSIVASGTAAAVAALGTAVAAVGAVGRALFVSPPTETGG